MYILAWGIDVSTGFFWGGFLGGGLFVLLFSFGGGVSSPLVGYWGFSDIGIFFLVLLLPNLL
jgi:hypothetical protein